LSIASLVNCSQILALFEPFRKGKTSFNFFLKKISPGTKKRYICNPKTVGIIAQSVEQRTENPCVAGSIPADTTVKKAYFLTKMGFFML
jgi:hypothetical protein